MLPHLWFRNTWGWSAKRGPEPRIAVDTTADAPAGAVAIVADDRAANSLPNLPFDYRLGERRLYGPPNGTPLFTNNETNGKHHEVTHHQELGELFGALLRQ